MNRISSSLAALSLAAFLGAGATFALTAEDGAAQTAAGTATTQDWEWGALPKTAPAETQDWEWGALPKTAPAETQDWEWGALPKTAQA